MNFPSHLAPETGRVKDVGLVYYGETLVTPHGSFEGKADRSLPECQRDQVWKSSSEGGGRGAHLDLIYRVRQNVGGEVTLRLVLPKINASNELPDDNNIHTSRDDITPQRRDVSKHRENLGRADVDGKLEGIPEAEDGILFGV